tara:strand:- start:611 stop:1060 length:450 start_codon:yes stop_codon:yes gene_type:complete
MRKLLTKKQREAWLGKNWRYNVLTFRYSGGVNGNIVKVLDKRGDIIKGVRCTGGGYDMTGTCLGQFIEQNFPEQIKRLDTRDFYGLTHWNTKTKKRQYKSSKNTRTTINGACGMNSMRNILEKIGFKLEYIVTINGGKVDTTTYKLKTA